MTGFKNPARPVGSFIFVGASGVGKTELCRALAKVLYGDKKKLLKIDMSEYMLKHEVSKLTGAAPGYVGHENGGLLPNLVKQNPKAVLCLDEIEKAHPDVFNIFLQIMEDGILTSSQGETISFRDILVIMTSNIGVKESGRKIGFFNDKNEKDSIERRVSETLKSVFRAEFLGRLDEVILFSELNEQNIFQICNIMLKEVKSKARNLGIKIDFDKTAVAELAKLGYDAEYGARPLRGVISAKIVDTLSDKILAEELNYGDNVRVMFDENGFVFFNQNQKKRAAVAMEKGFQYYEN
ncbi:hypothetical protein FACS1894188_10620 [Clostridia bacterium]|nr:hypothetical protein FACS1894188_10620 [Clostridia bacterium]